METVYNATNAAGRVIFGDNANNNSQSQSQNRNPNPVTTDTSDYDRPSASETNPFRQSGIDSDNNAPFRSTSGSTTKPFDSTNTSGYGSQHTATSGSGHEVLNKPYDTGVGSLEKSNTGSTYDQPSGTDFDKPSAAGVYAEHSGNCRNNSAGSFDKPTTTTSTLPKTSVGDLNKDGVRHETGDPDRQRAGVHSSNPTISTVNDQSNIFSSDHNKPYTSRFSEDTNTPHTNTGTSTGTGVLGGVGASHEHHTPINKDFSQSSTTDHSSSIPRSFDNKNSNDSASDNNNVDSSLYCDTSTTHTPHHKSGVPAQGSNIQSLVDTNPATSTSGISSSSKPTSTNNPSSTAGSSTHGAANSGFETANAAPKSVSGATGSGPGAAVEPSVEAHPGYAQQETQKQQGADRPFEEPSASTSAPSVAKKEDAGALKPLGSSAQDGEQSKGTGEKYEKSTGVAAEGGDFDASRPGAGREADRLLDEKGIHHGKETKPDTSDITTGAGHSKLLPGHKDKSHTDTSKDHHPGRKTASPPADSGSSGHKGLGEKIKEKLHIHH